MTNHLAALKEHIASYYTTDAREEIAWAVAEIEHLTRERDEWAGVAAERNREIANLRSDIAQLRGELSLAEEGLAEPELRHDSPEIQFADVYAEYEKGHPVNTQDLINAMAWKIRNQRREIAKLHQHRAAEKSRGES